MKIYYHTLKQMEAINGRNYSTTYYKINDIERNKLKTHIEQVIMDLSVCHSHDTAYYAWINNPLTGNFGKTKGKPNYTLLEIVTDLNSQLNAGKDVPSGMLGRWHRLFKDTEWDFDMVQRRKESKAEEIFITRHKLFKEKEE